MSGTVAAIQTSVNIALEALNTAILAGGSRAEDAIASIDEADAYFRLARTYMDTVAGEAITIDPLSAPPTGVSTSGGQGPGGVEFAARILDWELWSRVARRQINAARAASLTLRLAVAPVRDGIAGAGDKVYTVIGSQTIQEIAQITLGDWKQYKIILEYNNLPYNYNLSPGDMLRIPPNSVRVGAI